MHDFREIVCDAIDLNNAFNLIAVLVANIWTRHEEVSGRIERSQPSSGQPVPT